ELDIGCFPELAVTGPVVMATDQRLVFSFNAPRAAPGGRRADAGRAGVQVSPCLAFRFVYPNDQARPGHPLAAGSARAVPRRCRQRALAWQRAVGYAVPSSARQIAHRNGRGRGPNQSPQWCRTSMPSAPELCPFGEAGAVADVRTQEG